MTVNYTTNLALGQPVTGTESGTWGDDVNNSVTSYLDIAIAGGLAVTVTTTDVTLTNTQGTSSATNIGSTTAQYAILNVSGAMTGARNLIVPSSSKSYIIYNNTTGGYTLTVKGSATTGVGLVNGEKAIVAWNGSDYIKISSSVITNLTGTLPIANGGTNSTATATAGGAGYGTGTAHAYTAAGTSGQALISAGSSAPAFGTLGVAGGGTGLTTTPANGALDIGNGTGFTRTTLTAGSGITVTNASGAITIAASGSVSAATPTVLGTVYGKVDTSLSNFSVGQNALSSGSLSGNNNVAMGQSAFAANTSGYEGVAIGYQALLSNVGANGNTAVGAYALTYTTSGEQNTVVGRGAGTGNSTGSYNVSIGYASSQNVTTGSNSVAVGYQSLYSSSTGNNVAIGKNALYSFTSNNTVAVGYQALKSLTSGGGNTGVGYNVMVLTTTGVSNTAIGNYALSLSTTASYNNAFGISALSGCTTGVNNCAFGRYTLQSLSTSDKNSAFGNFSLQAVTTGGYNTAIGYASGYNISTGSGNIAIGGLDTADNFVPAYDITTQSNYISMGTTTVTNAYIQVGWTTVSDARDKTNFGEVPHGLDFVKQLQPVSYQFKKSREDDTPVGDVKYGFKAQDILALEGQNSVIIDSKKEEKLYYNADSLVPVLVKALQELNAKFDAYVASHP